MKRADRKAARRILKPLARKCGAVLLFFVLVWAVLGVWFVHHPPAWLEAQSLARPALAAALLWIGEPLGDTTDALGLTGTDATQTTRRAPPTGQVLFAGAPVRVGAPAPNDIEVLDRGAFKIGWSARLRHPAWVAYRVPPEAPYAVGERPNFKKDPAVKTSPSAAQYARSGYDRGHMAPNYAIASRFGPDAQALTFLMSNITPQSPALNRGLWRNVEHRIAETWANRWGEIWVIVGCLSDSKETLSGTDIDVPSQLFQLIVAQDGDEIRALALLFAQGVPWKAWPTRYLVTIDELEALTGYDFLPDLDDEEEIALEAQRPTRLWPVSFTDVFSQLAFRFSAEH